MEKKEKQARNKRLVVRLDEQELKSLKELQQKSTSKYLSGYARKVVLQKPVIIRYRNQSADEYLKEMLQLKNELHSIGRNFNQAVKKLLLLDRIPEFRTWVLNHESLQKQLFDKVDEIRLRMCQVYELWLLK